MEIEMKIRLTRKVGGRGLTSIKDCGDATIQGLKECTKKQK